MSKGNPRVTLRLTPDLLGRVEAQLASLAHNNAQTLPDVSEFIRRAVEEKLDHYRRSRLSRQRRRRPGCQTPLALRPLTAAAYIPRRSA